MRKRSHAYRQRRAQRRAASRLRAVATSNAQRARERAPGYLALLEQAAFDMHVYDFDITGEPTCHA